MAHRLCNLYASPTCQLLAACQLEILLLRSGRNCVGQRRLCVVAHGHLLLHNVGTGDDISQGGAKGDQFRTAPLWGVGQRLFFLHDGRFTSIVDAIKAHGGEAAEVIKNFSGASGAAAPLSTTESQNLVNFLRSL